MTDFKNQPAGATLGRRGFLKTGVAIAGGATLAGGAAALAATRAGANTHRWQIDPDKCTCCGRCMTHCVLDESAVKAVNCFAICGYCDICTGYYRPNYTALDTSAENQLCPTGAVVRTFVERLSGQRHYEYTIDEDLCVGCGKCVAGCAEMNGSLYLQVMHDRCVNCNECSIAAACPAEAFDRVPREKPYLMKKIARRAVEEKSEAGDA